MRSFPVKIVFILTAILQGCGTLIPGARRQVDIRKYSFSYDGKKVFYQEDSYEYKMLSDKNRSRFYVYLYDVEKRRHKKIARSAVLEVSPSGPVAYVGRDWKREDSADLYLFDYELGRKSPVEVEGLPEKRPFISISGIEWINDRDIIARVGLTEENPCRWIRKGETADIGDVIAGTLSVDGDVAGLVKDERGLPERKFHRLISPDGRYELKEDQVERHFMFHTSLYMEDKEEERRIYITKESKIMSIVEGAGYIIKYIGFGFLHVLGVK